MRASTPSWSHAPLVPEIALHLATEITPIWQATEAWLRRTQRRAAVLGVRLARRPGAGAPRPGPSRHASPAAACSTSPPAAGIAAIACALAGAASVEAAEIDPLARAAIALNAAANGVSVALPDRRPRRHRLPLGPDPVRRRLLRGADDRAHPALAARAWPRTAEVWLADPGRAYLPRDGLTAFASYRVPTSLELEDRTERQVTLYRLGLLTAGLPLRLVAAAQLSTGRDRSPSASDRRSRCPTPADRHPAWPSRAA